MTNYNPDEIQQGLIADALKENFFFEKLHITSFNKDNKVVEKLIEYRAHNEFNPIAVIVDTGQRKVSLSVDNGHGGKQPLVSSSAALYNTPDVMLTLLKEFIDVYFAAAAAQKRSRQ